MKTDLRVKLLLYCFSLWIYYPRELLVFIVVVQSLSCFWLFATHGLYSTPDSSVLHFLPVFAQTHVHWVSDAIQPSHLLSPPSLVLNLSQHRVFSSESALHMRWPKYWSFSFNINPSNEHLGLIFFLEWTCWISLQSKGLSRVFSNTTVEKHQFFGPQPSL